MSDRIFGEDKQGILLIASPASITDFKNRCVDIVDEISLATMRGLGSEPASNTFVRIRAAMTRARGIDWAIFQLSDINETIGHAIFFEELKGLIREDATSKVRTVIIDDIGFYKDDAIGALGQAGVMVVGDARDIGVPFSRMLTHEQCERMLAGEPYEDHPDDANRLPGMDPTTPSTLADVDIDPFAQIDGMDDPNDPFAMLGSIGGQGTDDLEGDLSGLSGGKDRIDGKPTGDDVFRDGDPFADIDFGDDGYDIADDGAADGAHMPDADIDISEFVGDVGGVMDGTSVADDVVGAQDRGTHDGLAGADDGYDPDDPFADIAYPDMEGEDAAYPAEDPDDPFMGVVADPPMAPGTDDGMDGAYDPGYGPDPYGDGQGGYAPGDADGGYERVEELIASRGGRADLSVKELFEAFGGYLSDSEYSKMASMIAPVWDYSLEHADKIGKKKLFGGKKASGQLSGAASGELAESLYIKDVNANGHYIQPTKPHIIVVSGQKGGVGKSLPDSTPIISCDEQGRPCMVRMGDIRPGDMVFNRRGEPVRVLEVHPQDSEMDVYTVSLRDGRSIECSGDHLWNVLTRGSSKARNHHRTVKSTRELMEQPIMRRGSSGKQEYRWRIPVADALVFAEQDLLDDPYSVGFAVGSGADGPNDGIPDAYLAASIEQRRALLQGFMAARGSLRSGRISFSASSRPMMERSCFLIRSLGYICSANPQRRSEGGEAVSWTVSIWSNDIDGIFGFCDEASGMLSARRDDAGGAKSLPVKGEEVEYDDGCSVSDLPIHPYLLGLIATRRTNGPGRPLTIACRDDYILHRAISCLPVGVALSEREGAGGGTRVVRLHDSDGSAPLCRTTVHAMLADLGCFRSEGGRISIPDPYLKADVEARRELLRGIMDGIGNFANSKALPCIRCGGDEAFRESVTSLAHGLGYSTTMVDNAQSRNKVILETDDASVFNSTLLREEMHNLVDPEYGAERVRGGSDGGYIAIVGIEREARKVPMTCILVDDDEHMFVAGDMIVTHNTTVSVGIATQLNWYFNREAMQRVSKGYNARVLVFSMNEFDDIPVHGVGYENGFDPDVDDDGKNVRELLRCIDEADGMPEWEDIDHCFVCNEVNKVFYLPAISHREMLECGVSITAADYKKVLECCKRFFPFIVVDTPDIFYHQKNDLMNFAYSIADVICMVMEPDEHSALHIFHFFDGLKSNTNRIPLNPNKCMMVVNKFVSNDNPYMTVPPEGQFSFETVTTLLAEKFALFACIPFTRPMGSGNILYGNDRMVKHAFAEIADDILEIIDRNDAIEEQKSLGSKRR